MVGGFTRRHRRGRRGGTRRRFFVGVRVDVDDHRVRCGGGEVFVSSVRACGGTDVGIDFSDRRALGVDRFGVVIAVVSRTFLDVGVFDFAGSGVVHVVGGCSALLSVIVVGPRRGRFTSGRKPNDLPAQSPVFQVIGGLFLWYGWFGFNCGSVRTLARSNLFTVTRVGVCTVLSGCAGGLTTGLIDMRRNSNVIHPMRMINGILTALVACSASSAYIEVGLSIVIGVVAGACYIVASQAMLRMKLDDVVDAARFISPRACGASCGALMGKREYLMDTYTENYKGCGAFYGCANAGHVFGAALIYVVVLISWTTAIILPTLLVLKRFNRLRVSVETEIHGLDVSQHGGASYSEFQTTIFKYKDASGTEKSMEMRVRAGDAAPSP